MRTWESRRVVVVFGRQEDGPPGVRAVYTGGSLIYIAATHRGEGLTDEGSYSKQRVAPKPSSRHAILSFHNERVPSRCVSRRNFNTLVYLTNVRPYPLFPLPFSLLFSRFRSRVLFFFLVRFFCTSSFFFFIPLHPLIRPTLFRPPSLRVPFSIEFLQVPLDIYREENSFAARGIVFLYFPAAKERNRGRRVAAVRLESGIYRQLNGLVPRSSYPGRRSFDGPLVSRSFARFDSQLLRRQQRN